jgi:threonine dehydratase
MISPDDIRAAYARIAGHVRRTPVMHLPHGAFGLAGPVSLKCEFMQHTGSFKPRGAFNTLLSLPVPEAGVAGASGGNHGAALAYAASRLGHRATIFVPEISPRAKVKKIRAAGAEVIIGGARYDDAQAACQQHLAESGAMAVHPFDAWPTIAGQGTVALEWEEQAGPLDTVLVAVGGGGLVAGMAAWYRNRVRVVAVEPENSRCLHAAMAAGKPVPVPVESIAADSLGARMTGEKVYEIAKEYVDRVVLVPDAAIRQAQRRLWKSFCIVAEPGGAAALAALLSGAYQPAPGERVGVLLCGGNVDLAAFSAAIAG